MAPAGSFGSYTHATEYWLERVRMMQEWSDYLDQLRQGGTVLSFPMGMGAA